MTATLATDFKINLKHYIDLATSGEQVIITRPKNQNVVLVSEKEYSELKRIQENSEYLFKLKQSFSQAEEGKVVTRTMDELEALLNG